MDFIYINNISMTFKRHTVLKMISRPFIHIHQCWMVALHLFLYLI